MFIPSAVLISWTCLRTELLPSVLVAMSLPVPVSNKAIKKINIEVAFRGGFKDDQKHALAPPYIVDSHGFLTCKLALADPIRDVHNLAESN